MYIFVLYLYPDGFRGYEVQIKCNLEGVKIEIHFRTVDSLIVLFYCLTTLFVLLNVIILYS